MYKPLVILTGPTAVGKTDLSIRLSQAVNGEIISADSMQVYRHMDIGTAKITKEEMQGIPHHLIDIYEPFHSFNVAEFKQLAKEAVQDIADRGRIPIVTGGTGFYIQALLYDICFEEEADDGYRTELEAIARRENGADTLFHMLEKTDPVSAEIIHKNNVKRIIRALEYYHQTGEAISVHNERERSRVSPYNFAYFVLDMNRRKLYDRIECRVDKMMEEGLVEEVSRLSDMGLTKEHISMQGLGYKEIYDYIQGNTTLEEAVYILKRDTRHFAKRQLTWFKRERDVIWINKDHYENDTQIIDFMTAVLREKGILT